MPLISKLLGQIAHLHARGKKRNISDGPRHRGDLCQKKFWFEVLLKCSHLEEAGDNQEVIRAEGSAARCFGNAGLCLGHMCPAQISG